MPRRHCWVKIPPALAYFDLVIDLAEIKHASIKAKMTGKLSNKVKKKWRKRDYSRTKNLSCRNGCHWLPRTVLSTPKQRDSKFFGTHFYWQCRKCRCVTQWVWEHELSTEMLNTYREHTRILDAETEQALAEKWAKLQERLNKSRNDVSSCD